MVTEVKMLQKSLEEEKIEEKMHVEWWQGFSIAKEIFRDRTEVQDLRIFENAIYGRVMMLDGVVQLTEADEFTYHEMMAHVPLFAHGKAKKVLVIGGGDGGVLREVLRHGEVKEAVLVDIDRFVINLSEKYFPTVSQGAFDDPHTRIIIDDGAEFVKKSEERFDVIICDSTDPKGPGGVLFTSEFYQDCKNILTSDGIMVNQHGVPFVQGEEVKAAYQRRKPHFKHVTFYTVAVPTYVGGLMTLGWATNSDAYNAITEEMLTDRMKAVSGKFKYWSPKVHLASFVLPPYIANVYGEE